MMFSILFFIVVEIVLKLPFSATESDTHNTFKGFLLRGWALESAFPHFQCVSIILCWIVMFKASVLLFWSFLEYLSTLSICVPLDLFLIHLGIQSMCLTLSHQFEVPAESLA